MSENTIMINENELSLADFAGLDMSEVEAVRFAVTPAGRFLWRVAESEIVSLEVPVDYDDESAGNTNIPCISVMLTAVNCLALIDDELDPADYIDIKHIVNFRIRDFKKDMGKFVAFLNDIGIESTAPIQALLDEIHGLEFLSDIVNNKSRNNPDIIFANLRNIAPAEEEDTEED